MPNTVKFFNIQSLAVLSLIFAVAGSCAAGSITVGTDQGGNVFPFGANMASGSATEYQEAYASSNFSGPISITGIAFFQQPGNAGTLTTAT